MSELEDWVRDAVSKRMDAVRAMDASFRDLQEEKLLSIVRHNADTEFGRAHGFAGIASYEDYRRAVPVSAAPDYAEAWKRVEAGERGVLFADPVHAFGLSSGTTGKPKKIPLSKAVVRGLRRAIGYTTSSYIARTGDYSLLRGYALQMSGCTNVEKRADGVPVGYITGIMSAARTYPFHNIAIPPVEVLDLPDWNEKYRIVEERYRDWDVRMIFGIPGYMRALLRRLAGEGTLATVWPHLSLVVTSGSPLADHRPTLEALCPGAELLETYLATESAVAFQPEPSSAGMVPMVEDVFLEFVPEERWGEAGAPRVPLAEVETGVRYVVLLTTPGGLYAYSPGDSVRFERADPPRLVVEGRTGNVINLAAEKLDGAQAHHVLAQAGILCEGYTVCPADGAVGHEWVIEPLGTPPPDAAKRIDDALRGMSPIYDLTRKGDLLMAPPVLTLVRSGTFQEALRRRPGQGKILPIYKDRKVRDELVAIDRG